MAISENKKPEFNKNSNRRFVRSSALILDGVKKDDTKAIDEAIGTVSEFREIIERGNALRLVVEEKFHKDKKTPCLHVSLIEDLSQGREYGTYYERSKRLISALKLK